MQTLTTPWVPAKSNLNPENDNSHTVRPPSDLKVLEQVVPFLFCFACRLSKCVNYVTFGNISQQEVTMPAQCTQVYEELRWRQ